MRTVRGVLVGAAVAMVAVSGCTTTGTTTGSTPSASATATGGRLDTVLANKVLRVCTTGDYLPYTHRDAKTGAYTGLDIDLVNSLASTMGVRVSFVATTWKALSSDFQAKCDVAAGGISASMERARIAFFSTAYLLDGKAPVTKCANVAKYDTIAEIDQPGVTSISPAGGTNEKFARANYPKGKLLLWGDNTTIFDQILKGRADVMTTDATEAKWAQKTHKGLCAVHPDKPFTHEQRVWLLPRGDVVLQQYVDQWFTTQQENGGLATTTTKWLG